MDPRDISYLLAYNRWANARMLSVAAQLDAGQLTQPLGGSYPSVRETLVHVLWAEWLWLRRWLGESPREVFDAASFEDIDAIRARWRDVEAGQVVFARTVTPEALARVLAYVNTRGETWSYPLGRMIQHQVNHSTYHRGQVAAMLRRLGMDPLASDLLVFVDEGEPGAR